MKTRLLFHLSRAGFRLAMCVVLLLLSFGSVQGFIRSAPRPQPPDPARPNLPPSGELEQAHDQLVYQDAPIHQVDHSLTDLDLRYIRRTPVYAYNATKKWPNPGEIVTFTGYLANRGGQASGPFSYRWNIDGNDQPVQNAPSLTPGQETTLTFSWAWQVGVHMVRLTIDPNNQINEFSKVNNIVEDRTNGITLGIYVDQAVYDFFNTNVWKSGWGGNSFDDWIQRLVNIWNQMFIEAVHPLTPNGVLDRVRLGKVVVVPNGGTHCNTNFPADDRELDLIWGFLSESVGVSGGCSGWTAAYRDNPALWDHDMGLIHELNHARYLIDLYGLNVDAHPNQLSAGVSQITTTLPLMEMPDIQEYVAPFTLVVDGEIVVCNGKSGLNATGCQRGQAHTNARPHAANAPVYADAFLITDGLGNALVGDPALPATGYMFWEEPYYFEDVMDSGPGYGEHSAYAWNRIAGQRAMCGNANAPCNIGEYLYDIPADNALILSWPDGTPVRAGVVDIYRPRPFPVYYGQSFLGTPDLTLYTDIHGQIDLGSQPFGSQFDVSGGVLLLKVTANGKIGTLFFDVTRTNIAYWQENKKFAVYTVTLSNFRDYPVVAPTANFIGGPYTGTLPVHANFSATQESGTISIYHWDFGDGTSANGKTVTHSYTRPGLYDVSLSVFGPAGGSFITHTALVQVTGESLFLTGIQSKSP